MEPVFVPLTADQRVDWEAFFSSEADGQGNVIVSGWPILVPAECISNGIHPNSSYLVKWIIGPISRPRRRDTDEILRLDAQHSGDLPAVRRGGVQIARELKMYQQFAGWRGKFQSMRRTDHFQSRCYLLREPKDQQGAAFSA